MELPRIHLEDPFPPAPKAIMIAEANGQRLFSVGYDGSVQVNWELVRVVAALPVVGDDGDALRSPECTQVRATARLLLTAFRCGMLAQQALDAVARESAS